MRPVKRGRVNKFRSANKFRGQSMRSNVRNLRPQPMRGGWRM